MSPRSLLRHWKGSRRQADPGEARALGRSSVDVHGWAVCFRSGWHGSGLSEHGDTWGYMGISTMAIPWGIHNGQNRMMMNQWMDVEWDALLSDAILSSDEPCGGSLLDFLPSTASTSLSPPLPMTPNMFSIHLRFESFWLIVQCCFQCKYS